MFVSSRVHEPLFCLAAISYPLSAISYLALAAGSAATAGDLIPAGPVVTIGDGATVELPIIKSAPGDRYIVVWAQESGGGCAMKGRFYDTAGVPTTAEYLAVPKIGCCGQLYHGLAVTGGGDLLVAWPDGSGGSDAIVAQTFAPDGTVVTPQFSISVGGAPDKFAHAVAESDGGYTVFWYAPADMLVSSLRFDSNDAPVGAVTSFPLFTTNMISLTRSSTGYLFLAPRYGFELLHRLDDGRQPVGTPIPAVSYRLMGAEAVAVDSNGNPVVLQTYENAQRPDRIQRFCDSDDPTCDRCNGFDDTVDDDGDGLPNACDLCTNVADARTMEKPRMFVTRGGAAKIQKFRSRGTMTLPVAFSAIDPGADSFRVALLSPLYGHIVNDRLASPDAADGSWELKGASTWKFKGQADFGTSAGRGEWIIKIKALGGPTSNRVRVSAKNSRGSYGFRTEDSLDLPPRTLFNFGDESEAESDLCGEAIFAVENCRTKEGITPRSSVADTRRRPRAPNADLVFAVQTFHEHDRRGASAQLAVGAVKVTMPTRS